MATATGSYVSDNSSLANFQSWTSAIFNAFVTTCGWVQTADTGQAANPPAAVPSSTFVYWIFKANDAQAATLPIFVKLEVGYSATSPQIRVTVGTGSNGSGTITGAISFNQVILYSLPSNGGATAYPCYFSGDAGEFRMLLWVTNTTNGQFFAIERSKDSGGNKTTGYFTALRLAAGSSGQQNQQTTVTTSTVANLETNLICCVAGSGGPNTGAYGGTVAAFPVFPLYGQIGNPMLGVMAACGADVADAAMVTVASMYGSTHTYVACKTAGAFKTFAVANQAAAGQSALLVRYE